MYEIKAIETRYKGYRFRSRLEARWAVFFETLGIPWEYEKEGFDLGEAGYYLPDFWLPEQEYFIEVKGGHPTDEEECACQTLAKTSGYHVFILVGQIPKVVDFVWRDFKGEHSWPHVEWPNQCTDYHIEKCFGDEVGGWDCGHDWHECTGCGYVGIRFPESDKRLKCGCDGEDNCGTPRLRKAYAAARSARFEHGESG